MIKVISRERTTPLFTAFIILHTFFFLQIRLIYYLEAILVLCGMFCRSLFVPLSVLFWPFRCLSLFDLRILITLLVSWNSSYEFLCRIKYVWCHVGWYLLSYKYCIWLNNKSSSIIMILLYSAFNTWTFLKDKREFKTVLNFGSFLNILFVYRLECYITLTR